MVYTNRNEKNVFNEKLLYKKINSKYKKEILYLNEINSSYNFYNFKKSTINNSELKIKLLLNFKVSADNREKDKNFYKINKSILIFEKNFIS